MKPIFVHHIDTFVLPKDLAIGDSLSIVIWHGILHKVK